LETSLYIAVARATDARETFGDTAERPDATAGLLRFVALRTNIPDFEPRAPVAPPRAAFETTAPRAVGTPPTVRTLARDVVAREIPTDSALRAFCDDAPRGLGAWTPDASKPQHIVASTIKHRKRFIWLNIKIHLSVICILPFFGDANQAHFVGYFTINQNTTVVISNAPNGHTTFWNGNHA
jgi:hypothetical protein